MSYRFMRARNLSHALEVLQEYKEAVTPVAGGTNFTPDYRSGRARPAVVLDISGLPLRSIHSEEGWVRIGALSTVTDLLAHPQIPQWAPVLAEAVKTFAGHLVRNRATVAGNLVDASPAADLAPPLMALDAEVTLVGAASGSRTLPLSQFTLGVRKTARRSDELVTEIAFRPASATTRCSYFKFALREAMAISVVSGAVVLQMDQTLCSAARIVLGAVGPTPVRATSAEAHLVGHAITAEVAADAAARVGVDISPITDVRATAEYRTWVAEAMVKRHILAAGAQGA